MERLFLFSASALIALAAGLLFASGHSELRAGWKKDFAGPLDERCVERALRTASRVVERMAYVSDGGSRFPQGSPVTAFIYPDPDFHYGYSLQLAQLPNGGTRFVHEVTRDVAEIPAERRPTTFPLLYRANGQVA